LEEKFFTAKSERLEQLASKRGGQHSQQQNEQLAILEAKTTALDELLEQRTRIRAKLVGLLLELYILTFDLPLIFS
jgi:hypothetical protein